MNKEFDLNINEDPVAEVKQKEQEKKIKKVGTMKPHRGHTVYQYNTETGELTKAIFEEQNAKFNTPLNRQGKTKVIMAQEGCIYVSALNIKNAIKRLGKYHGINVEIQ